MHGLTPNISGYTPFEWFQWIEYHALDLRARVRPVNDKSLIKDRSFVFKIQLLIDYPYLGHTWAAKTWSESWCSKDKKRRSLAAFDQEVGYWCQHGADSRNVSQSDLWLHKFEISADQSSTCNSNRFRFVSVLLFMYPYPFHYWFMIKWID